MKRTITVYFDGAAWLWKKAGYGYIIKEGNSWLTQGYGAVPCTPETSTNNVAEHYAVYKALVWLLENGHKDESVKIIGDSKLVISQLFRGWKCRDYSLPYAPYMEKNKELLKCFSDIKGKLIPREMNMQGDDLSKEGLRSEIVDTPIVPQMGTLFNG